MSYCISCSWLDTYIFLYACVCGMCVRVLVDVSIWRAIVTHIVICVNSGRKLKLLRHMRCGREDGVPQLLRKWRSNWIHTATESSIAWINLWCMLNTYIYTYTDIFWEFFIISHDFVRQKFKRFSSVLRLKRI